MANTKILQKRHIHIIIAASVLALLIVAYTVINTLFTSGVIGPKDDTDAGKVTYDESIGESQYLGTPTVYSHIGKENLTKISVQNSIDSFVMERPLDKDSGKYYSYFVFSYLDEQSGKYIDYMPNIAFSGEKFDYESLYAIETADGLNATKVEYLCAMIGALYFQSKVRIEADTRDEQLKRYGLDAASRDVITVDYLDESGAAKQHVIYVGDKLITGAGYYFMLDGRDMIYASAQSDRLSVVLGGFEQLVSTRIVAQSYKTDGAFEPYLTTGYKQWSNTYYGEDKEGETVKDGSLVIFNTSRFTPDYENSASSDNNGYINSGFYSDNMLDLREVKDSYRYDYIRKVLCDMKISKADGAGVQSTVLTDFLEAELYNAESGKGVYSYSITDIEAIYTQDSREITEKGTLVGESGAKKVKVTYNVALDGKSVNQKPYHAVIDLESANAIPAEAKNEILMSSIGKLPAPINFEVKYTYDAKDSVKSNVNTRTVSFKIVSINQIYKIVGEGDDQEIKYLEKIDSNSIVYMSVCYVLTDEYGNIETTPTDSFIVDLSGITEGDNLTIKNAILGMGAGEADKTVVLGRKFYQDMQGFEVYDIKRVIGFMEQDLNVAFKFINKSERDDFYAESSYKNILGELDEGNKYAPYAVNVENCDRVVRILGGISSSGTSQGAVGLSGAETVAVGLTPQVMIDYHLYEGKTISFGLPRGVDEDPVDEDDYIWDHALTFTLYISPVQYDEDGSKYYYVGSDMYDTVVKFVSDDLDYLDYTFPQFWARRNMVMISSSKLDKIELDFDMSDLYGSYNFDIVHEAIYIDSAGNHHSTKPEGASQEYDFITVFASINGFESGKSSLSGEYTETELSRELATLGFKRISLSNLYNRVAGKPVTLGHDTAGTGYYKEMLMILFSTYYMGVLSDADMTEGAAKDSLMKLSFTVKSSSEINKYVYEFKRLDDRRIMVSFYVQNGKGETSEPVNDFYITDFAFKKIVSAYTSLLSGKEFDADTAYGY